MKVTLDEVEILYKEENNVQFEEWKNVDFIETLNSYPVGQTVRIDFKNEVRAAFFEVSIEYQNIWC